MTQQCKLQASVLLRLNIYIYLVRKTFLWKDCHLKCGFIYEGASEVCACLDVPVWVKAKDNLYKISLHFPELFFSIKYQFMCICTCRTFCVSHRLHVKEAVKECVCVIHENSHWNAPVQRVSREEGGQQRPWDVSTVSEKAFGWWKDKKKKKIYHISVSHHTKDQPHFQ